MFNVYYLYQAIDLLINLFLLTFFYLPKSVILLLIFIIKFIIVIIIFFIKMFYLNITHNWLNIIFFCRIIIYCFRF